MAYMAEATEFGHRGDGGIRNLRSGDILDGLCLPEYSYCHLLVVTINFPLAL
jgi:hypothetical protein